MVRSRGIVVREAVRHGFRPFVFFRGKLEEARSLPTEKIKAAFRLVFPVEPFNEGLIGKFKEAALQAMQKTKGDVLKGKVWNFDTAREEVPPAHRDVYLPVPIGGGANFRITYSKEKDEFMVHQYPATHGVQRKARTMLDSAKPDLDPFLKVKRILAEGFKGEDAPDVTHEESKARSIFSSASGLPGTYGHTYTVKLMPVEAGSWSDWHFGHVNEATKNKVLRVDVWLPQKATERQLKEASDFYRREFDGFQVRIRRRRPDILSEL